MSESRYIKHGSFGLSGNRVRLLQSRATGNFVIDTRGAPGSHSRRHFNLDTTDIEEAKQKVRAFLEQLQKGKPAALNDSVLYVVQRGDDGPIKIGISRRLKNRLSQLQSGSAEKLKLLRVYTMADVGKAVHAELEEVSRLEGEWFPADLLPRVRRFFNVPFDISLKRRRAFNQACRDHRDAVEAWKL